MLAKFVVMAAFVRLQLTLLYYFISSTPFFYYFSCPHLFYEKRILSLNKFIKNTAQILLLN